MREAKWCLASKSTLWGDIKGQVHEHWLGSWEELVTGDYRRE